MSGCLAGCPHEQIQQDVESIGPVLDGERIIRGAFAPSHGNAKTGNVRHGVFPVKDLISGECSVWRASQGRHVHDLAERLKVSRDDILFRLIYSSAKEIRDIKFTQGGRAFCVLDECDCDNARTIKHPWHAHISFCKLALKSGLDPQGVDVTQAKQDLYELMKRGVAWELAA